MFETLCFSVRERVTFQVKLAPLWRQCSGNRRRVFLRALLTCYRPQNVRGWLAARGSIITEVYRVLAQEQTSTYASHIAWVRHLCLTVDSTYSPMLATRPRPGCALHIAVAHRSSKKGYSGVSVSCLPEDPVTYPTLTILGFLEVHSVKYTVGSNPTHQTRLLHPLMHV